MPASNLPDLAEQLCDVIGVQAPELVPDSEGELAFSIKAREVDLTVTHDPIRDPDHALVYLHFGEVPEDREVAVLRELLHANLVMLGPQAPAFSRNPLSGRILLQYAYPMSSASGAGLWEGMQGLIEAVLQWRRDFSLNPDLTPSAVRAAIDR